MSAIDIGKNIFAAIGVSAITVLGSIWIGAFDYWNKDRGQDIQMVNIALSILGGENKDTSLPGRKFALRVLEKYADVEIPGGEFDEWATQGTLPRDLYIAPEAFWNRSWMLPMLGPADPSLDDAYLEALKRLKGDPKPNKPSESPNETQSE